MPASSYSLSSNVLVKRHERYKLMCTDSSDSTVSPSKSLIQPRKERQPLDYICSECNEWCGIKVIDTGLGSYEYWGAVCHDSHKELVSTCCEVPATDPDTGNVIDEL